MDLHIHANADLERLLSTQLVHSERVTGSHHVLLCACKGFQSTMPGFMAWLAKSPLETVCLADWHISRLYLLQPVEETDLITTRNIHNASISRKGERDVKGGRRKGRGLQCHAFIGSPKLPRTYTSSRANACTHRNMHPASFWQGMRFQRAVWCFSSNLSFSPDQIHWLATEDDVTIPQLSLPLSVTLHNVCVCVCEKLC